MNIRVHIERLILEGLPAESLHSAAIGRAVEMELARLLTAEGLGEAAAGQEAQGRIAHLTLVRPEHPVALGRQIGSALYQALNQTSSHAEPSRTSNHVRPLDP